MENARQSKTTKAMLKYHTAKRALGLAFSDYGTLMLIKKIKTKTKLSSVRLSPLAKRVVVDLNYQTVCS